MLPHAALLALIVLAQPAGGAAIDLPSYISDLERTSAAIRTAAAPADAAASVPERWTVRIDRGAIVVDARWIRDELSQADLQSWPAVRTRVAARLDAMRLEALEERPRIAGDPGTALAETLARREFQRAQTSDWYERMQRRISAWFMRLFSRVFGSASSRTAALVFAWVAAGIALTGLLVWLTSVVTRRSPPTVLDLERGAPRTAAREWALRALAAVRSGSLREAVRCGYRAAVQRLGEQGAWTIDDSRTPREYMRLLDQDDPRRHPVDELTRRFEQIWYGNRTPTGDDAREVAAQLERLGCLRPGEQAS